MLRPALCLLFAVSACQWDRLVPRPEDCPTGCFTAAGQCVDGRSETACGKSGLACGECAVSDTCVEQACRSLVKYEALTWGPRFVSAGERLLSNDVARLTTLQPEDAQRAGATPVLYGLRPAARDIVSLGDWDGFGTAVTSAAPAVAPGDELSTNVIFFDVFSGNRRLLMTGYAADGVSRLFLHSTRPTERPVGTVSERVSGAFTVAPVGDFYFLSAPGVMNASGPGVYGFLDGPSINTSRKVAGYSPAATAGVGMMASAAKDLGLFGAFDTATGKHTVYACTLAAYMDAYVAAANQAWPLNLQSCAQVYSGGVEVVSIAGVADGFAVLERTATSQTVRFVPLIVNGTGSSQTVGAGPVEVLAEAAEGAQVESVLDYGADVLLVVRTGGGRAVHRAARTAN